VISTKSFLKSSLLYGINNVVMMISGFVFLPIYGKYLSNYDFGIWGLMTSISPLLFSIIHLGTTSAIGAMFYNAEYKRPALIADSMRLFILTYLIFFVIAIILRDFISSLIGWHYQATILLAILILFSGINNFATTIFQIDNKPILYAFYSSIKVIVSNILLILFVTFYKNNWISIFYSAIVIEFIYFIVSIILLIKEYNVNIFNKNIGYSKQILSFSLPLLPSIASDWLLRSSNRIFLSNFVSVEENGLLTIGYKFGNFVQNINQAISRAFGAYFFSNMGVNATDENTKKRIVQVIYLTTVLLLIVAIGLLITSELLVQLFVGNKFIGASKYVFFIALSFVELSLFEKMYNFLLNKKKTFIITSISLITGLSNVGLNYFLIKKIGSMGAIYSLNISYFLAIILTWVSVNYYYKMPWFNKILFRIR